MASFGTVLIMSLLVLSCETQKSPKHSTTSTNKAEQIAALIDTYAEYGQFNGAALVADGGEVIFKKAYGMANMEWDIPNATDTKFRLASVSKQFTAMLAVQLAAAGKLDLNAPISDYLTDFPKDKGDIITAHHLLTHTSGLPSYTNFNNYRELMLGYYSPAELVAQFADSALIFEPGFRFDYSNSGYALLGYLIETITGKSYGEVLQAQIFDPLQMNNSGYDSHRDIIKNRASGYYKNGLEFVNASYIDMSVAYAAGGVYSTVEDLYLWDQALYTDEILPLPYRDLLFEKHASTGGHHYGYGWNMGIMYVGNTDEKIRIIDHDGVINGFTSSIIRIPESQSSIILLNNTGPAPLNVMSKAIAAILTDKSYDMPLQSMAEVIYKTIEKQGLKSGLAYFEANKENNDFYLSEDEFNQLGYAFLQIGKAEEAAALFKINMDTYPTSFNVYDSYAEAILALGDTVKAIELYEQSIQMNPENENGIQVLKTLKTMGEQ
jgi:CubicO group peptidase (beta-lactamase class C family)